MCVSVNRVVNEEINGYTECATICYYYRYEAQRENLQQQSFNMEQAQMTTENLRSVMATVDAMQTANKEMKRQYKNVNLDKIDVNWGNGREQKDVVDSHDLYDSLYKTKWRTF